MTKQFSLEEIVARVRALVLRRNRATAKQADADGVLPYADLVLDDEKHLVWSGDQTLDLPPTEYVPLRFLMENAERVKSKVRSSTTWGSTTSRVTGTSSSRT